MEAEQLKRVLEAALLAATSPLTPVQLSGLFVEEEAITHEDISRALEQLALDCEQRGIELKEVASGFRFQVREDVHAWVARLWTERPSKYSRALLETLALIAYRQPITRAEIEQIRGVAVSSHMVKTLEEREWIRVVGYRDVPGKPALFGTTRNFLDYFNLRSLDELPALAEIRDLEEFEPQLDLNPIAIRRTLELPPEDDEEIIPLSIDAEDADTGIAEDNSTPIDDEPATDESLAQTTPEDSPTADGADADADAAVAQHAQTPVDNETDSDDSSLQDDEDLSRADTDNDDPDEAFDPVHETEVVETDDDSSIENPDSDENTDDPRNSTQEQEQQVDESTIDTATEPHASNPAAPAEANEPTASNDVPEHTA